jgi:hypothetical protein
MTRNLKKFLVLDELNKTKVKLWRSCHYRKLLCTEGDIFSRSYFTIELELRYHACMAFEVFQGSGCVGSTTRGVRVVLGSPTDRSLLQQQHTVTYFTRNVHRAWKEYVSARRWRPPPIRVYGKKNIRSPSWPATLLFVTINQYQIRKNQAHVLISSLTLILVVR